MIRKVSTVCFLLLVVFIGFAQLSVKKQTIVYKEIDGISLSMDIYQPEGVVEDKLPAIVFFFGGGWVKGTKEHFKLQAEYLASRGIVAFCPEYRVKNKHNTSPFECVKDAKSAIRYIKENANKLGIDQEKIVTSGGSAGGHLAACTALIDHVNEEGENLEVSTQTMALILFNPVLDTKEFWREDDSDTGRQLEISPVHHITEDVPFTLIMHGMDDTTVPFEQAVRFKETMKQFDNQCKLVGFPKQKHGFFNYTSSVKNFEKTLRIVESTLDSMNLLKGKTWLKKYMKGL